MIEKNYISMPYVIKQTDKGDRQYDIFSRLLEERVIFIANEITNDLASVVMAQLLLLESEDPKKDIMLYINSNGGSMTAGLAIYDTMKYIKCDVQTICIGMAASMAAILLAGGTKGKRFALPNAEILIHQPLLSGVGGQATEIEIVANHIVKSKQRVNELLSKFTGQTYDTIEKATDRDNWMTASEAKDFGLIDKVIFKH